MESSRTEEAGVAIGLPVQTNQTVNESAHRQRTLEPFSTERETKMAQTPHLSDNKYVTAIAPSKLASKRTDRWRGINVAEGRY